MLDDELGNLVRQLERDLGSPATLGPRALAGLLDAIAARPRLWQPCVRHEPVCRWYGSLFRDDVVDLWLLTWQQDNRTELHDHGGSSGAFRVVAGTLAEDRPRVSEAGRQMLTRARRQVGETVAFGPRLVHDVHNLEAVPAVSLHVYSPPLEAMTYYDLDDGKLRPRYTEPVGVGPVGVEPVGSGGAASAPLPGRAVAVPM